MYQQALRFVANKAIQALFDSFNVGSVHTQGANVGGGWGSVFSNLIGAFAGSGGGFGPGTIGAGLATGGMAQAGSIHPVNENGPELLSFGSRDYLMMGNQSGKVTPIQRGQPSGGNHTQIINVNVQPTSTRRTADQVAQSTARAQRIASSRNA